VTSHRWSLDTAHRRPVTGAGAPGRRRRAVLAFALLTASVWWLGAPSAHADANLLVNPGLESVGAGGFAQCWDARGWGDNDATIGLTGEAHTGARALRITMTARTDGDRKAMPSEDPSCAPDVVPDHQYDLSFWYTSSSPDVAVTVFRHDVTDGWQYWTDLATLPVAGEYERASVRTPPVPPNTDQLTWGATLYGVGELTTDDYAMADATLPTPDAACSAGAACTQGRWQVLPFEAPVRGVHSVVMKNGKVLLIAGSGNDPEAFEAGEFTSAVYDPRTGRFTVIPTPDDMFCSGHVQLADGRVLIMGGNLAYPAADGSHGYKGLKASYLFDPDTEQYVRTNDMHEGHWYPSATVLGNGDVISVGGLNQNSSGAVNTEYFSSAEQRWLTINEAKQTWSFWGLYPAMILMQDGRLFYSGSHTFGNGLPGTGASIYDYEAARITDVPGLQRKDERDQSASVLLPPAQDQRVLTMGGANNETGVQANRLTDLIDLKQAAPAYQPGPLLPQGTLTGGVPQTGDMGKHYLSAVLLPDGKVFETGGGLYNRAQPVFEASMFDPATDTFTPGMATDPVPRGYHSSGFLLPDGRVMTVGDNPGNGSFDQRVSIYTPPYLFHGARPQVSVTNTQWAYGSAQRITVDTPIVKASLIRPAAVTHSSDPNQRYVDLPLTVVDGVVDVNVTSNPNIAPPGWYMLFAVNAAGVPSVADWVQVGGAGGAAPALGAPGGGGPAAEHQHAAPNVQDFAAAPKGVTRTAPATKPAKAPKVTVAEGFDGCDHRYGALGVCVPWKFPKGVTDKCGWLRENDFLPLAVHGRDRHRIDSNGDGRACAKGDTRR
jgi:hypothetical protein